MSTTGFWVLVILPGMFFVPESPWWLVRMGRMHEAEEALRRLSSSKVNVSATLAVIAETDRLEREIEAGSTYLDCFNKANWRRTEISIGVYCTQVLSGIYLINYGTYFFQQAGLATEDSFYMSIGFLGKFLSTSIFSPPQLSKITNRQSPAVGFVGTLGSWFLMLHFGRRPIFVQGLGMLVILQLIIGILDCVPGRPSGVAWAESTLMLVWNFAYDLSIGPVCFALLGECSAARVRSKTIAVATAAQGVIGIIMTVAIPYMINPDQANMQGKLGFFFGGLAALCYVWAFFRVPETRGRSYDELDSKSFISNTSLRLLLVQSFCSARNMYTNTYVQCSSARTSRQESSKTTKSMELSTRKIRAPTFGKVARWTVSILFFKELDIRVLCMGVYDKRKFYPLYSAFGVK